MLENGAVVLSLAGRDKGRLLVVVGNEAGSALVCDGKERPVERPKRKNYRHLRPVGLSLDKRMMAGNRVLRKTLRALEASEIA